MSYRKKARLINWDVVELRSASWHFWLREYDKAGKLLFPLMQRIIVEPLKDTQEYKDGERKPEAPVHEQQEEVPAEEDNIVTFEDLFSAGEIDPNAPQPERDDDGYLVDDQDDSLIR